MIILVLTNIYPAPDLEKENTPVVHYFTREWVKIGHSVYVVHYPANFSKIYMWVGTLFKKHLSSQQGASIRPTQAIMKKIWGLREIGPSIFNAFNCINETLQYL